MARTPPGTPPAGAPEPTFETGMSRLEEIVHELEQGSLGLQQSLDVFREGMQLATRLGQELEKAETQVQELVEAADGTLRTRAFGDAGSGIASPAALPADTAEEADGAGDDA